MVAFALVLALQDPEQQLAEVLRAFEAARQDAAGTRAAFEQLRGLPSTAQRANDDRIDELLYAIGDEAAVRLLEDRVRAGVDQVDQMREVDYLARLGTPASRAALFAIASDEAVDADVRLEAAERLRLGGADPRRVLSALAQIRTDSSEVSAVQHAPVPKPAVVREPAPVKREPTPPADDGDVRRARFNIILASVAVALAILMLATRRRA